MTVHSCTLEIASNLWPFVAKFVTSSSFIVIVSLLWNDLETSEARRHVASVHQTDPSTILVLLFSIPNFILSFSSCTVWVQKIPPERTWHFFNFFSQTIENFNRFFTHLLCIPIYARLQIFIQISPILTKLCHIERDYPVDIICSKCPPSAETHTFRRLRKSMIALLIVVCSKSL